MRNHSVDVNKMVETGCNVGEPRKRQLTCICCYGRGFLFK